MAAPPCYQGYFFSAKRCIPNHRRRCRRSADAATVKLKARPVAPSPGASVAVESSGVVPVLAASDTVLASELAVEAVVDVAPRNNKE